MVRIELGPVFTVEIEILMLLGVGRSEPTQKNQNVALNLMALSVFHGFRYFRGKNGPKDRQENRPKIDKILCFP